MNIGAHLSVAGGHANALDKLAAIGGTCLQFFSISPRGWEFAKIPDDTIAAFREKREASGVGPVYFHASYLVNLADQGRIGALSRQSLTHELRLASKMGVRGSIIHLGSFKEKDDGEDMLLDLFPEKYKVLVDNISHVIAETPDDTVFIMENAGNRKIGRSMDEVFRIVKDVASPRLKICLDTCHLHAAGYDLTNRDRLDAFVETFDKAVGLEKLELWHVNDSRDPFGSLRDRHENIGEGFVGIDTFRGLVNHPALRDMPMIIETPGFDDNGPDKENIDILKGLVQK